MSPTLIEKLDTIERCVVRIRQTWNKPTRVPFSQDFDKQDIITLNLQRLFESLNDICKHLVRERRLGLPRDDTHAFELMAQSGPIDEPTKRLLKACNGMRNIIVHRYRTIDLNKLEQVVDSDLNSIIDTGRALVLLQKDDQGASPTRKGMRLSLKGAQLRFDKDG